MGNFIDLAAVLAPPDHVRRALESAGTDAECYSVLPDRALVLYGETTGDLKRMQKLSLELNAPVVACHIHDDDLWLYEFYLAGKLVDKFNTLPSYWEQLTPEEEAEWKGNADLLAQHWPALHPDSLRRYLRNQDAYLDGPSEKAYPDDEFEYADCWQLTDFLRKLGTPYPESSDEA